MQQSTRWRRRKDARPQEILDAALEVFAERGFAAARLDDVAARAGVTKGTVYLYFDSKEELFKAVVRQSLLPNLAAAEAFASKAEATASDLLRQFVGLFVGRVLETKLSTLPKIVIAESGNFPELARFYHAEAIERGLKLVGGLIARGIASGEFRTVDPASVAPLVVAPLLLLALHRNAFARVADVALDAKAIAGAHLDILIRGLAADDPRRSA
jgi:AcrR family transcriptional regulator